MPKKVWEDFTNLPHTLCEQGVKQHIHYMSLGTQQQPSNMQWMLFQKTNIYHGFTLFQAKERQPCKKHLISNIEGQKAMENESKKWMIKKEIESITSKPEENKNEKINRNNKKAKIKPKYSSNLCF